jgi:hypothetical protein
MANESLIAPFVKDQRFEQVLIDMNEVMSDLETQYVARFDQPKYPPIFIAGVQRSGTTLLMQLLIASFQVGYVSNLAARFWKAPYIGTLLARELQRKQRRRSPDLTSELGTTYGYDGPHEFGYFWQQWFPYSETHETSDKDLKKTNTGLLRRELAAIESVFDCPLAFKNPIVFSLNMKFLADIFPAAVFLICHRKPLYVAQSTLLSRIKFHGRKDLWFSTRPREYTWLQHLPYPEQIAGQVFFTEQRIKEALAAIDSRRWLVLEYKDLCIDPSKQLGRIQKLMADAGYDLVRTGFQENPVQCSDVQKLDDEEFNLLKTACDHYYKDSNSSWN